MHIITPTTHPLESLAASLTRDSESVTATATLIDDLNSDPRSLHLYVRKLLSRNESERLLLVVDQFEELFTACKDPQERKVFIDNLLTAIAEETSGPTVLIITLRADFYHHCAQFGDLRAALEDSQKFIGAMDQDELRRAKLQEIREYLNRLLIRGRKFNITAADVTRLIRQIEKEKS